MENMKNGEQLIHSFNGANGYSGHYSGLTKREYFAGLAMQGLLANGVKIDIDKEYPFQTRASTCVMMADALLKELDKQR